MGLGFSVLNPNRHVSASLPLPQRHDGWIFSNIQDRRTWHASHITRHASHGTRHTSHVTRHSSHVTRHTSHVTHHTSHVTRHTSHFTGVVVTSRMTHATPACFTAHASNRCGGQSVKPLLCLLQHVSHVTCFTLACVTCHTGATSTSSHGSK